MNDNKRLISINLRLEGFYFIFFIVIYNFPKQYHKIKEYNQNDLIQFMTQFSIIIFFLIEIYLSKKIKKDDSEKQIINYISQNYYPLIDKKIEKNNYFKIFLLILSTIIFELIAKYSSTKMSSTFLLYLIDLISLFIIQTLFFKEKFYSHQYIVIIFHLLGICIILTIKKEIKKVKIFLLILILINQYCFCFSLSLCKKINTSYYINIYFLGSIIGLSRFIYLFIHLKYIKKIDVQIPNFENLFLYIYIVIRLLYYYLYYTFLIKFNPFIIILCQCCCLSFNEIFSTKYINIFIKILFSITILIPLLIFGEIIELNFCGLSDNLKYMIEERGKQEDDLMKDSSRSNDFNTIISTLEISLNK